jgi:hypothetical protein
MCVSRALAMVASFSIRQADNFISRLSLGNLAFTAESRQEPLSLEVRLALGRAARQIATCRQFCKLLGPIGDQKELKN